MGMGWQADEELYGVLGAVGIGAGVVAGTGVLGAAADAVAKQAPAVRQTITNALAGLPPYGQNKSGTPGPNAPAPNAPAPNPR